MILGICPKRADSSTAATKLVALEDHNYSARLQALGVEPTLADRYAAVAAGDGQAANVLSLLLFSPDAKTTSVRVHLSERLEISGLKGAQLVHFFEKECGAEMGVLIEKLSFWRASGALKNADFSSKGFE